MPDLDYDDSDEDCPDAHPCFPRLPSWGPVIQSNLSEKLLDALVESYQKQMEMMEAAHQKQIETLKHSFELQIQMMARLHQEQNSKKS